jgi:hypothetical protein
MNWEECEGTGREKVYGTMAGDTEENHETFQLMCGVRF